MGTHRVAGNCALIVDDDLATALGVPALIWWPGGADVMARLEAAARDDDVFVGD